jgi:hypothetical protein
MKGSHAGASSPWALYASRIAARALGRRGVWQHRDERRFVCATRVLTSSGYAATSASAVTAPTLLAKHLDRPAAERFDADMDVVAAPCG